MSIGVRRLGPADAAAMRKLNAVFAAAFEDPGHYPAAQPNDDHLGATLARDHVIALAAEIDGIVVGGLTAYELDKLEQPRREIYIYNLAVLAEYRRRGIATMLIGDLRRHAGQRGAWVVYVQADHGDDPAIALYTKLGEREDVMHFDMTPLPPAS